MSAVRIMHSYYQGEISFLMRTMRPKGFAMVECAVQTRKGTKVADVAWASLDRMMQICDAAEALIAPEVCVEVLSSSNTASEMVEKRELYFERGALEFWTCDESGDVLFFDQSGALAQSVLFPNFPTRIEI